MFNWGIFLPFGLVISTDFIGSSAADQRTDSTDVNSDETTRVGCGEIKDRTSIYGQIVLWCYLNQQSSLMLSQFDDNTR